MRCNSNYKLGYADELNITTQRLKWIMLIYSGGLNKQQVLQLQCKQRFL